MLFVHTSGPDGGVRVSLGIQRPLRMRPEATLGLPVVHQALIRVARRVHELVRMTLGDTGVPHPRRSPAHTDRVRCQRSERRNRCRQDVLDLGVLPRRTHRTEGTAQQGRTHKHRQRDDLPQVGVAKPGDERWSGNAAQACGRTSVANDCPCILTHSVASRNKQNGHPYAPGPQWAHLRLHGALTFRPTHLRVDT